MTFCERVWVRYKFITNSVTYFTRIHTYTYTYNTYIYTQLHIHKYIVQFKLHNIMLHTYIMLYAWRANFSNHIGQPINYMDISGSIKANNKIQIYSTQLKTNEMYNFGISCILSSDVYIVDQPAGRPLTRSFFQSISRYKN